MALDSEQPPFHLAYLHDIPGSRCDPEDGWPKAYQILPDVRHIWSELTATARPHSVQLDRGQGLKADSLNFQPCPGTRTQDRYVVQQLDIHGRTWTLTGVFDGHLGDATVEHVAHHLPIIVRDFLREAHAQDPFKRLTTAFVSNLLSHSITSFDDAIAADVLNLFPGGIEGLSKFSDEEIRQKMNDPSDGGANFTKARLCMYGTTALVALIDPQQENLWIANVGDCQAALVSPAGPSDWKVEVLTTVQNGDNDAEIERVRREHPGESECVQDRRILGALAPFRCLGDVPFKQPPEFTRRILYNLLPDTHDTSPWEEFLVRNRTPPYISAEPEVVHRNIPSTARPRFLVLCSDGFTDLCQDRGHDRVLASWASGMVGTLNKPGKDQEGENSDNMALRLLKEALGGDDKLRVSAILTLDMDEPWVDDTALVVQTL